MLSDAGLETILRGLPDLTIGVVGDLFLDRYLDIDASLTEVSLETGLDAYQVVRVRSFPGAAGTVINNLVALGVKWVCPVAVIGDDGEGYELRQKLAALGSVNPGFIHCSNAVEFRTPSYTKPMLHERGSHPRELNRIDIKNHKPLGQADEAKVLIGLDEVWPQVHALLALDQVSEAECGVITRLVRERLSDLGRTHPDKLILADSRERIGLFRSVSVKPNREECLKAVCGQGDVRHAASRLAEAVGRPVICTLGDQGILITRADGPKQWSVQLPAYAVEGPIDSVGAGDSTSAGIACALAAGASLTEAAAFGSLVASITIQQLGTTGTATPAQVRQRWRQVQSLGKSSEA
jgi:bifunctional ADP-heptose synthase (sugar kinase/adenylyltransferase)